MSAPPRTVVIGAGIVGLCCARAPGLGELVVDVSYGGNFYAIVELQKGWAGLDAMSADEILRWSPLVRTAVQEAVASGHPENDRIASVSHVMWADKPKYREAHARNAVFNGAKGIDRSPRGTGSSARMAQRVARGQLAIGDDFVHESIIDTLFHCRVEAASVAGRAAIRPSIGGWARITSHNTILVDSRDPLALCFQLA